MLLVLSSRRIGGQLIRPVRRYAANLMNERNQLPLQVEFRKFGRQRTLQIIFLQGKDQWKIAADNPVHSHYTFGSCHSTIQQTVPHL